MKRQKLSLLLTTLIFLTSPMVAFSNKDLTCTNDGSCISSAKCSDSDKSIRKSAQCEVVCELDVKATYKKLDLKVWLSTTYEKHSYTDASSNASYSISAHHNLSGFAVGVGGATTNGGTLLGKFSNNSKPGGNGTKKYAHLIEFKEPISDGKLTVIIKGKSSAICQKKSGAGGDPKAASDVLVKQATAR